GGEVAEGDVADLRRAQIARHGRRELCIDKLLPVISTPTQVDVDRRGDIGRGDVFEGDVLDDPAAAGHRLDPRRPARAGEGAATDGDVANPAGGLRAHRNPLAIPDRTVADEDVFGRLVDAQPVGIAPGFHANVVVITADIAAGDADIRRGVDVDAVGTWRLVRRRRTNGQTVD